MCPVNDDLRNHLLSQIDDWAGEGMRLLGLAYRQSGVLEDYSGYTWVGLLGMEDPVREGVVQAIQIAQHAGVQVKMITGDYRRTAEHIASGIGLMQEGEQSVEGEAITKLTDEGLRAVVKHTAVFSRIRPQDKLRIVRALQANGEITAMIGDGVNDAPAMARATLGVAMGAAGSDAAIETADVALMADDLSQLPWLVRHSRRALRIIRQNIILSLGIKVVFVLLTLGGYAWLWAAIAADMGVSLVVIANALRLLRVDQSE